ncbi:Sterol 3-beta-glucosyltransferase UGT80A2 [Ceratocystis lukuohia]|uniref:Sterol 3-beta-glucosyltransferase UGT80A2 n=1 Tax=Ceratocystis lukuohia TaxID=2019550 RepID=A0ABR4MEG3_9PEZI
MASNRPSDAHMAFHAHDIQSPDGAGLQTVIHDADENVAFPSFIPPRIEMTRPEAVRSASSRNNSESPRPGVLRRLSSAVTPTRMRSQTQIEPVDAGKQQRQNQRNLYNRTRANTAGANNHLAPQEANRNYPGNESDCGSMCSFDEDTDMQHRQRILAANALDPASITKQRRRHRDDLSYFNIGQDNCLSRCRFDQSDGRLSITLNDNSHGGGLARLLGISPSSRRLEEAATAAMSANNQGTSDAISPLAASSDPAATQVPKPPRLSEASTVTPLRVPRMNIVIMVIGSRGDVQPFLRIGQVLQKRHGHRVRIATHPDFRQITEDEYGLEHFSVGGDPAQLMAFMVKNPGMIPTLESVKAGEIGRKRASMEEMFEGFWRACVCATDDPKYAFNSKVMAAGDDMPFVADAIIANPPSYAHVHCAEALNIPLHIVFTFPYSPTQAFPHPMAAIKHSNVEPGAANLVSYPLVDMMVWQGLGDLVNDLRIKTLSLDGLSAFWAPAALSRLRLPYTYIWSPGLVPKPADWGSDVDIAGFVFATNGSNYQPEPALAEFLAASEEPPIYIGFGSIVVDDPTAFTNMIFEAVRKAGVRALVSKGWGKLGGDDVPENIYMLGNIPHDWLFPKVRAAVIHGGAGTTAIALKCALPTMVVPFFGDQNFWGSMIAKSGAGPQVIPYKELTADKFADGIRYLLTDEAKVAVQKLADSIAQDGDGAENTVNLFHSHLDLKKDKMHCSILDGHTAVWATRWGKTRFSPLAAAILVEKKRLTWKQMHLIQHHEFRDFYGPGEPITGLISTIAEGVCKIFVSVVGVPVNLAKTAHKNHKSQHRSEAKGDSDATANGEDPAPFSHSHSLQRTSTHTAAAIQENLKNEPMPEDPFLPPGVAPPKDEYLRAVASGVGRSALILFLMPLIVGNAIAQGFHNAPLLYGDTTVRPQLRVTGIKSGLRATQTEIVYGVYDAFTGVVTQPYHGAKTGGTRGFVKGVGMGLGGLVIKNIAAATSIVYAAKGVVRQAQRHRQPKAWVRRARIIQSVRELEQLSPKERDQIEAQVLKDWEVMFELFKTINDKQREPGLRGFVTRKRAAHDIGNLLDSADNAKQALDALKRGESLDEVFRAAGNKSMATCWKTSHFAKKKAEKDVNPPTNT